MGTKKKQTKAQMRVTIAKDVIAALDAKKIEADTGTYCSVTHDVLTAWMSESFGTTGYDALPSEIDVDIAPEKPIKAPKKCTVCAIGSVFMATVDRFDKLQNGLAHNAIVGGSDRAMIAYLEEWFTSEQLRLMEAVFEGADLGNRIPVDVEDKAVALYERLNENIDVDECAEVRMRYIMKNIIRNKGTFVLPSNLKVDSD